MKKSLWLVLLFALVLVATPLMSAYAAPDYGLTTTPDPIDPQSWKLNRDMTWADFNPNPVMNWMEDLNPASLDNKFAWGGNDPNQAIVGGLVMIEYLDRKFISRGDVGSDPLGYYLYNQDGSMQDTTTNNPVFNVPALIAEEKGIPVSEVTDEMFAKWWSDYLNVSQKINNYAGIDEFWREVSYGKWAIDLRAYGPFTIPYFEFETMGYDINTSGFQTYRDVPPSFRTNAAGTAAGVSFDTQAQNKAVAEGVPFGTFDFFFLFHAGYDESGVWQEFGQAQFKTRKDIPYELGPGPRMKQVEEFFTANPEWLTTYEARYRSAYGGSFWKGELDKYNALVAAGTPELYEFHLSQADWDWVNGYSDQTQRNTRYVNFTSWEAAVGEWSHAGSFNYNGRTIRRSTQGENDGMATFAHEFGHISGITDNYGTPWTNNYSPATEPWELMSRGSFAGPFGDHARWTVPGIEAGSVPTHFMNSTKTYNRFYDDNDVLTVSVQNLAASTPLVAKVVARNIPLNNNGFYPQLEEKYGLVSPNFYKAIKLTFGASGSGYQDLTTQKSTGFTWTRTRANNMSVEVVQRTGYDSFLNDDGVLIARNTGGNSNPFTEVVDSHLYDISMIDYELDGEYTPYPIAHAAQLADAAFKVGISSTDTGYYASEYDPADPNYNDARPIYYDSSFNRIWTKNMLQVGSITQWEEQGNRAVVSGDTVNEFYDQANKLRFYILEKNLTPAKNGEFLSYTVGVLRTDGVPVGGELKVDVAATEEAIPGRVAVAYFDITNTGEATDIIRLKAEGDFAVTLLNNLYAVGAGETVTVPVYVQIPADQLIYRLADLGVSLTASSESNGAKVGFATVTADALVQKIAVTSTETGNKQGNVNFDIVSANGKGYTLFLSAYGPEGPYSVYDNVNYNSKGAHVKGLNNNQLYYAYVEYDLGGEVLRGEVAELALGAEIIEPDPVDPVDPGAAVLTNAVTSVADILSVSGTSVTFNVTETYDDGTVNVVTYTVAIVKNGSGNVGLGQYVLVYDIKGNGSNIKEFRIVF